MKSVSIIDKAFAISEPSKMIKEIVDSKNVEKLNELKNNYIIPFLKQKNIEMPKGDILMNEWQKINNYTMSFIKRWLDGYIQKTLEKKFNFLNYTKVMPNMERMSAKDLDIPDEEKPIIAKVFAELIYKATTFETKSNEYLKEYIIPLLEKEEKIIFDLSSTDENTKLITQETLDLFLKYIHEQGSMTFHNSIFNGNSFEDIEPLYNYFNFLYVEDIEIKKMVAEGLVETFVNNYNKIDFTKKTNKNIIHLYSNRFAEYVK